MRSKLKINLAEKLKAMRPGEQFTLKDEKERRACFALLRAFKMGSVITTRVITTANGDGTFAAVALRDRKETK